MLQSKSSTKILEVNERIVSLAKVSVFTTLDADSWYRQAKMNNGDRDMTAFTTHHELCRIVLMRFKLRNGASTIQRTIDVG